jgi:hypothetical protein
MSLSLLGIAKVKTTVAVLALVVLIVAWVATRVKSAHHQAAIHRFDGKTLDIGDHVEIPGVDFSHGDLNIVVAASPSCPASRQSVRLYRRLQELATASGIPFYFVQAEQDVSWLDVAGNVQAISLKPSEIGIKVVPVIAIVDRSGVVRAMHLGSVKPDVQESMIGDLIDEAPTTASPLRNVTEHELVTWRKASPAVQVVDVQEISNHPGMARLPDAVEIPATELGVRAHYELDKQWPIVVDCRPLTLISCQTTMIMLRQDGFTQLAAVMDYRKTTTLSSYFELMTAFMIGYHR